MKLKVLESSKTKLMFELEGADHTFCNVLKDKLVQEKDVEIATYTISHPLVGKPVFIVETSKIEPKKAILSAIKSLKDTNTEFLKQSSKL